MGEGEGREEEDNSLLYTVLFVRRQTTKEAAESKDPFAVIFVGKLIQIIISNFKQ